MKAYLLFLVATASLLAQPPESHKWEPQDSRTAGAASLKPLRLDGGAGKWKKTPIDLSKQQDRFPRERAYRNQYWSMSLPSTEAHLYAPTVSVFSAGLPSTAGSLIVLGTFRDYQVFEPLQGRGAYAEVEISVETLIPPGSNTSLAPGSSIAIDETGGTIVGSDRAVHEYYTDLDMYPMQPKHRYLLIIRHHEQGDFYTVLRKWDVSNGIVLPAGKVETEAYLSGKSVIAGRPLQVVASQIASSQR